MEVIRELSAEEEISKPGVDSDTKSIRKKFLKIFSGSPSAVALSTLFEGRYIDCNAAFLRVVKLSHSQVIGRTAAEIGFWDAVKHREMIARLLTGEPIQTVEVHFQAGQKKLIGRLSMEQIQIGGQRCLVTIVDDLRQQEPAEEELRETQENLNALVNQSPVAIVRFDPTGNILSWNRAATEIFGWREQEVVGGPNPTVPELLQEESVQLKEKVLEGAALRGLAVVRRAKDGALLDVSLSLAPLRDRSGGVNGLVAIYQDVSQLRRMESACADSNAMRKAVIDASPLPIVAIDLQGNTVLWNAAAGHTFGWTAEEVIGKPLPPIIPQDQIAHFNETIVKLFAGEAMLPFEAVRHHKNGTEIDVQCCAAALSDGAGQIIGSVAVYADIRKRKQAEKALRESESKFRRIFESGMLGVIFCDLDGRILDANAAFREIFGYASSDVHEGEWNCADLIAPAELGRCRAAIATLRETGICHPMEIMGVTRNGRRVPITVGAALLESRCNAAVAFVIDNTERELLSEGLRQAQRLECVGRLAGGLAHDFNTLLAVIHGHMELMQGPGLDEAVRSNCEKVMVATKQAASLVTQLLTFSRKQLLNPRVIDLNVAVVGILEMLKRILRKNIKLTFALDNELRNVYADPAQLDQVVLNLAMNAQDAMPNGGSLRVETKNVSGADMRAVGDAVPEWNYVLLQVSDTGTGMDEETRQRIFEPFFTTKEIGKGTGLGLSTVYGIVKQSGGQITVASKPGEGACFHIYLPEASAVAKTDHKKVLLSRPR